MQQLLQGSRMSATFTSDLVKMCTDPFICGFPLPDSSISFLQAIIKFQRPRDVKYSIIAGILNYIQYQLIASSDPIQIDELIGILRSLHQQNSIEVSVFIILSLNLSKALRSMENLPFFKDLVDDKINPNKYITNHFNCPLSIPSQGKFQNVYELIISEFVYSALVSNEQSLVKLTVDFLPDLSLREGDLPSKIAPFINQGVKSFDASIGGDSIIKYGISFIMQSSRQKFTSVVESFRNLFDLLTDQINNFGLQLLRGKLNHSIIHDGVEPLENLYLTISNVISDNICHFIERNETENCISSSNVCRLLLEFMGRGPISFHFVSIEKKSMTFELTISF